MLILNIVTIYIFSSIYNHLHLSCTIIQNIIQV